MAASGGERSGCLEVVAVLLFLAPALCSASGVSGGGYCAALLSQARIERDACSTTAGDCCQMARSLFASKGSSRPCTCLIEDKAWLFTSFLGDDRTQKWLAKCTITVESIVDSCKIKSKNLASVATLRQATLAMSGGLQGFLEQAPGAREPPIQESTLQTLCDDKVPYNGLPCEYQKSIGKCSAAWMATGGFCRRTCGVGECSPLVMKQEVGTAADKFPACTDIPPDLIYTCDQQKEWGKCNSDFLVEGNFCAKTCERAPCTSVSDLPPSTGLANEVVEKENNSTQVDSSSDSEPCSGSPYSSVHNNATITSVPAPSQLPGYMSSAASLNSCVSLLDGASKSSDLMFLGEVMKVSQMSAFLNDSSLVGTAILPTDSALVRFYESLKITKDMFLSDVALLQQVIKKHFIPNLAIEAKSIAGQKLSLMSLSGEYLYFDTNDSQILASAAADGTTVTGKLVAGDLQSCGSIVHIVDTVLVV